MSSSDLKARVFGSLDNALSNGYPFMGIHSTATDLQTYDADLEDADTMELIPLIKEWYRERMTTTAMRQSEYVMTFRDAYMECALWSSNDESDESGGVPLDANYGPEDINEYSAKEMLQDCLNFVDDQWDLLRSLDPGQCGHDFWLTRNRHGVGFWDRGLGKVGDLLTDAAHVYGESDLYVGDDGKIHVA